LGASGALPLGCVRRGRYGTVRTGGRSTHANVADPRLPRRGGRSGNGVVASGASVSAGRVCLLYSAGRHERTLRARRDIHGGPGDITLGLVPPRPRGDLVSRVEGPAQAADEGTGCVHHRRVVGVELGNSSGPLG